MATMTVMADETLATHKITLSSPDVNNPLPDLATALTVFVTFMRENGSPYLAPITAGVFAANVITYVPPPLPAGIYYAYATATWPDTGVSHSAVWEIDVQTLSRISPR